MQMVVTLGDLVGQIEHLEIRCKRCDRRGRVRLAKLIEEHGTEIGLPDLATRLAAGCPKAGSHDLGSRCFVYYPQLLKP